MTSSGTSTTSTSSAGTRLIAVDIDDTLNDFTSTLRRTPFPYTLQYSLPEKTFHRYLAKVRNDSPDPSDLLSTEYSLFRYKIHEECYRLAAARADAVDFMQWLKSRHWHIFICTRRDLRRAHGCTRSWLSDNGIPFDHLFSAVNKIAFCRAWGIPYLVDDDANSIAYGPGYGVSVFHPVSRQDTMADTAARAFRSFDEIKRWIQE
jgi:uncharacterized HAD superfamily protein